MLVGQCGGVVTGYAYVKVRNPDGSFKVPHEQWLGLPDDWFSMLNGTLGGSTRDEYDYFSNYQDGIIFSDRRPARRFYEPGDPEYLWSGGGV